MKTASSVKIELNSLADEAKARKLSRFFRTGKGQYGEGDIFLGITVPDQRKIARRHADLPLHEIEALLENSIHEYRLTALLILIEQYQNNPSTAAEIAEFYLNKTERINNWDLVDLSCYKILGHYLENRDRSILYELAASGNLWKQRIALVSTYHFIKNGDFADTLKLCEMLIGHEHDLIHKASGWMLRETGKKDLEVLRTFLDRFHKIMPRTMLRYSIEKLDKAEKIKYMARK